MDHRILLVREWDSQTTGSGCCGRLGGHDAEIGGGEFHHNRCEMEAMGAVYRALRAELRPENVDVQVVDPRNMLWLVPTIWRDARRGGASRGEAARALARGVSYSAVIVDGRILFSGHVPPPDEAVDAVFAALAA